MKDLAILYYSADRVPYGFKMSVQEELFRSVYGRDLEDYNDADFANGPDIITITQKPTQWCRNICVGEIGASIYNVYRQIMIGAKAATAPVTLSPARRSCAR